jgi:hypothetical protein
MRLPRPLEVIGELPAPGQEPQIFLAPQGSPYDAKRCTLLRRCFPLSVTHPYAPGTCKIQDGPIRSESVFDFRRNSMELDIPEVVAEVRAAFDRYEQAVVSNDVATLDMFFRDDPRTIRYGATENLYGYSAIKAFRAARSPIGLARTLSKTTITTFGRDYAVASTLFHRTTAPGKVGRQTQSWVRFPDGWRIVVGHVSVIEEPAA